MADEKAREKRTMIQLVVFRLRSEEFGIPITKVREIVRIGEITHIPRAPHFIKGIINLRGEIIACIDLARQFQIESTKSMDHTKARIVVAEIRNETMGIIVDEVPEVIKIREDDIKPTPEVIETKVLRNYIQGVGKIDDRLLVVLDLDKILVAEEFEDIKKLTSKTTQKGGSHGTYHDSR